MSKEYVNFDGQYQIQNSADFTKALEFNVAPLTTGTTVVLSSPTASDTIAGIAATQTLTNKTITGTTNTVRATQLGTTGSDVVVSAATAPTTNQALVATSSTTAAWSNAPVFMGNSIYVDAVYGNDSTGTINRADLPFLTITAALGIAASGDVVFVRPGSYNSESFPLLPGPSVSIVGTTASDCIVNATGVTSSTTMLRLNGTTYAKNLTLACTTSTAGINQTGVYFNSSGATSSIFNVSIKITNTSNGVSSTVYGVQCTGVGGGSTQIQNINNCYIQCSCTSMTSGSVYGAYPDSAGSGYYRAYNSIIYCTGGVGSSTYAIYNGGGGSFMAIACNIFGTTADYDQSSGNIYLIGSENSAMTAEFSKSTNQLSLGVGGATALNTIITAPAPAAQRTYTIPDFGSNDTFVGIAATQTLSNKTILQNYTSTGVSYSAATTDYFIGCTAVSITITFPTAASANKAQVYRVKDLSGSASVLTPITVNVSGGGNIDGSTSITITSAYGYQSFFSNGTQWYTGG